MGKDYCRTLCVYSEPDPTYFKSVLQEVQYNYDNAHPGHSHAVDTNNHGSFSDIIPGGFSEQKGRLKG
jgi:hypothetical protein